MSIPAGLTTSYGSGSAAGASHDAVDRAERGSRRRRLAAMAGSLYRTGQQAVTDLRDNYAQSRLRAGDADAASHAESVNIPNAFPDVAIVANEDEQMVLFPSYAKRHVKRARRPFMFAGQSEEPSTSSVKDEQYWRREWDRHEDEKAIVDVDVRGWIYSPQVGPMTRRNRILIGLARQLSGISAPATRSDVASSNTTHSRSQAAEPGYQAQTQEDMRVCDTIAEQAAIIEQRGQEEKRVAGHGAYSEQRTATGGDVGFDADVRAARRTGYGESCSASDTHSSATGLNQPPARQGTGVNEYSDAELVVANANLMARVAPFLAWPQVAMPITLFFYNDERSQSRTVLTNDAGHFDLRAQLEFVPTHVRVLADERLSATQPVKVTEPYGVSLISDVDDTIKYSNISGGAREIFRNTFVRDLSELTVDGVREWYGRMDELGVSIHYCSNGPWQLFPVLATFFKRGGLPTGSLHLKQYSGMLQGIFEPVAERKKTTLNHLMTDFPERKFLLVGDSGEADLEVYTELALANPGRILAIFIRDVTTPPEKAGFFDSTMPELSRHNSSTPEKPPGPAMGTLIDLSTEMEVVDAERSDTAMLAATRAVSRLQVRDVSDPASSERKKPAPPPRPAKPATLQSRTLSATGSVPTDDAGSADGAATKTPPQPPPPPPPPPPRTRRSAGAGSETGRLRAPSPLRHTVPGQSSHGRGPDDAQLPPPPPPPPPPPRSRAVTPSSASRPSPRTAAHRRGASSNSDVEYEPLPKAWMPTPASLGLGYFSSTPRSGAATPLDSPELGAQTVNKKLELWQRRLERAHEQLDRQGVTLYTWRRGQDVMVEAEGIVKGALEEMGKR